MRCVVTTVESDSHVWNLVYLQLLLEERGARVRNLGGCTPVGVVVRAVLDDPPDLLVISSVNGHGHHGVRRLLAALAARGLDVPCVAGGKLTLVEADSPRVRDDLIRHGCADVFHGPDAVERFTRFLDTRWPVDNGTAVPPRPVAAATAGHVLTGVV